MAVARAAVSLGITKIRVTGGEPLIRKGVVKLVRELNALDGLETVALTTNGVRLAKYASVLKAAGLRRVNVSLDSLVPDTYRAITRGGDVEEVVGGIDEAIRAGLSVKINAVLFEGMNTDEIEGFVAFARRRGIAVRFIERMSFVLNKPFVSETAVVEWLRRTHTVTRVEDAEGSPHVRLYDCDGVRVGFISPRSHAFCAGCNKLRLTPKGELRACLASRVSVNIKGVLRNEHSDADLLEAIREAVRIKPAEGPWTSPLEMWRVGG